MTGGRAWAEALLWVVACASFASLAPALRDEVPGLDAPRAPVQALGPTPTLWSPDSLVAWADRVGEAPPFRLDRLPADSGLPIPATPLVPAAPAAPRPPLVVQGIIGRSGHWEAVIAGVPGETAGVLVQTGDSLSGGLHVRRIGTDTVVVAGRDTTYILVVRREWP